MGTAAVGTAVAGTAVAVLRTVGNPEDNPADTLVADNRFAVLHTVDNLAGNLVDTLVVGTAVVVERFAANCFERIRFAQRFRFDCS